MAGFDKQSLNIRIDTWSVVRAALALLLIYALFLLRDLVLVVLTAVVIASGVEPATKWFVRHKVPRLLAVVAIYLIVAVLLFGIFYFLVPPLLSQATGFLNKVPQYINSIGGFDSFGTFGTENSEALQNIVGGGTVHNLVSGLSSYITNIPGGIFNTVSAIFGGAFSFILIVVISFYLSVQKHGIESFLAVITPFQQQDYVIDLWRRSQSKIGRWMQGQLLLVILIAVLVYLGLTVVGVKHAFLFALLAGVFELIPLFGPILASIPAILIGFADGGVTFAAVIAGIYIIIQQFENHLIYPLVVNKVVGVPALLVILALIIGGQLAGFLGIILAAPMAAVLMEFTNDIEKQNKKRAAAVNKAT